ncbi:MAG: hypothetical protein ACFE9S_15455 [Candidatus Hermodarchaeota archaeon]
MTRVNISCPSCKSKGSLEVSDEHIKSAEGGLLAVNITKFVCEHSFIAYIDQNFIVRDYFIADFQINIPDLPQEKQIKDARLPDRNVLNLDLIKLNLTLTLISNVLRAIFCGKKTVLIEHQPFLNDHIRNFFKYITKNSFDFKLDIVSKEEYKKIKKTYKDWIILQGNQIIKDPYNIIEEKKIKVERQVVNQFLSEFDLGYSYITLINEINKAYTYSKAIVDFTNAQGQIIQKRKSESSLITSILDEVISRDKYIHNTISEYLSKEFKIKIDKTYLNFLMDIITNYFNINIRDKIKVI